MIGKNFIANNAEIFSEHHAKISPENFLMLSRNRNKNKMLAFTQLWHQWPRSL